MLLDQVGVGLVGAEDLGVEDRKGVEGRGSQVTLKNGRQVEVFWVMLGWDGCLGCRENCGVRHGCSLIAGGFFSREMGSRSRSNKVISVAGPGRKTLAEGATTSGGSNGE